MAEPVGLVCPCCGGETEVRDSRPVPRSIRRRRHCVGCGHRYTTYEVPACELEALRRLRDVVQQQLGPTLAEIAGVEPSPRQAVAVAA